MSDLAPKCSEVREDISKGSNCNQASSNMLTQQVRIIRLQACQMHYYASCSVLSGPVLSLLLMIVQLFHISVNKIHSLPDVQSLSILFYFLSPLRSGRLLVLARCLI